MHDLLKSWAVALPLAVLALASPAKAADDAQFWANTTAVVKLSDRWRLSEDITARFSDDKHGLYELELNTLLGYRISKNVTVWAGYTHDPNYIRNGPNVTEHRAREQVTIDNLAQIGRGRLSARIRTEQRWREHQDGTGWRIRPYLKYSLPLKEGRKTALVLSVEPFFNLNTTSFQRTDGLDRTRSFIGLSTPVARNITAEVGYLNQHAFVRDGADNDDHIASVALSFSL
jgi:hypothetical protein